MSYNNYNNNNNSNRFGRGRGGRGRGGRSGGRSGRGGGDRGGGLCKYYIEDRCHRSAESCHSSHLLKSIGEAGNHEDQMKDIVMWEAQQQVFTCSSYKIKVGGVHVDFVGWVGIHNRSCGIVRIGAK